VGLIFLLRIWQGSGIAGEGLPVLGSPNLAWAWPEVWVNDDQFEDALVVVEDVRKGHADNCYPSNLSEKNIKSTNTRHYKNTAHPLLITFMVTLILVILTNIYINRRESRVKSPPAEHLASILRGGLLPTF